MKVGPLTDSLMLLRVGWCDWMIKRQTQFLMTMLDCDDDADAWWLDGRICDLIAATMLFSLKSKRCYELTIYIFVDLAEAVNHRVCFAFSNVSFSIDADNVHIKRSTFWKLWLCIGHIVAMGLAKNPHPSQNKFHRRFAPFSQYSQHRQKANRLEWTVLHQPLQPASVVRCRC